MATAPQRTQRDVVEFPPNVPQTVALKYGQGKLIAGQYGERMMFTLVDERIMFVSPEVAGQIAELGINVRENFTITKRSDGKRDSVPTWEVARCIGEQPNGTLVVPKPPASATAAIPEPRKESGLVAEGKALVDDFAVVLAYALDKYQGRVKPDEVRNLLVTAYIQTRRLSSVA